MIAESTNSTNRHETLRPSLVNAAGWTLGALLLLNQIWASTGFLLDDEITHFWRSHSVWQNPKLLFDAWTRPGRNLLHVPAAPLGLFWTRLYTCVLLGVGVWLTTECARKVGVKSAQWIPLLLLMQPWVVELGSCVLTQTPFLLVWITAIYFDLGKKPALAGFLFGYLPLVRHEGIALSACYALYCTLRGRWLGLVTLPIPIVTVDLAAHLAHQPLITRVYLDIKPTELYGSGPLWHFVVPTIHSAGYVISILAICSFRRVLQLYRQFPLFLTYPAYFALHSLIYWKGLFASGGYVYFLMPMAPIVAISARFGIDKVLANWNLPGAKRLFALSVLLIVVQAWMLPHRTGSRHYVEPNRNWSEAFSKMYRGYPLSKDSCKRSLDDAKVWIESHPETANAYIVCCHSYLLMKMGKPETPQRLELTYSKDLETVCDPILFVWESKYAPHNRGRQKQEFERLNWSKIKEFDEGAVIIYSNIELLASQAGS